MTDLTKQILYGVKKRILFKNILARSPTEIRVPEDFISKVLANKLKNVIREMTGERRISSVDIYFRDSGWGLAAISIYTPNDQIFISNVLGDNQEISYA